MDRRFKIAGEESVEEVIGEKGGEQKSLDGVRLMLIDVIGVPAMDEFVEPLVFDIPSRMTPTRH